MDVEAKQDFIRRVALTQLSDPAGEHVVWAIHAIDKAEEENLEADQVIEYW